MKAPHAEPERELESAAACKLKSASRKLVRLHRRNLVFLIAILGFSHGCCHYPGASEARQHAHLTHWQTSHDVIPSSWIGPDGKRSPPEVTSACDESAFVFP